MTKTLLTLTFLAVGSVAFAQTHVPLRNYSYPRNKLWAQQDYQLQTQRDWVSRQYDHRSFLSHLEQMSRIRNNNEQSAFMAAQRRWMRQMEEQMEEQRKPKKSRYYENPYAKPLYPNPYR